jgi:TonB-dependent receptor
MSRKRGAPWVVTLVLALGGHCPAALAQAPPAPPPQPPAAPPPAAPPAQPAPPAAPPPSAPAPTPPAEGDEGEGEEIPDEPEPPPAEQPGKTAPAPEEAEISDEELLEGEENPGRPPPKGKGVVFGVVSDVEGPLIEAPVQVVGNKKLQTVTDIEGRYRLELPPGTYSLRFSYELHKSARFDKVFVEAGKVVKLDTQLLTDEEAVDTVEIVEKADASSLEGLTLSRQRSTAIGDQVGRGEISKTPAANAAQAAQRVPGATIVGNRFVYVRGLGERYTNSLLNGAPLPSPEPDRAAIPLDVFPSLIIDSISIVKTFTPDSPADFAGGSVRIDTRELPTKPLLQGSIGLGFDEQSTFQSRLAQRGSPTDWLGFDSGMRDFPESLKGKTAINFTPEQSKAAAQDLNSYMSAQRYMSAPNHSLSAVAGNGWQLPNDQRLGALLTFDYGRRFEAQDEAIIRSYQPETGIDYRVSAGVDKVNWGALGSVSYWPASSHRLTLLGLHTQLADSSASLVQGFNGNLSANIVDAGLRYVSRALNFGQLRGEHDFASLANARLTWNASLSRADRSEPDTRHAVVQSSQGSDFVSIATPDNGSHLSADQHETSYGGGLDWTQPFSKQEDAIKAKVGGLISIKKREFAQQRFHLEQNGTFFSCGQTYQRSCPDTIYTPENIDNELLLLAEDTRPEDAYHAKLNVFAAYAMMDIGVFKDLRLIGGARIERTDQVLNPYSQFGTGTDPKGATLEATDVLPSVALAFSATKRTKLRVSVARTLARPQLRELAPFAYAQFLDAVPFAGNPDLKITYITNYDTRFEFYPTLKEVLALSFFYKTFKDPIENVIIASGSSGLIQPVNTPGATLVGIELEARKSLEFLAQQMKDFSFIGNLTLARSQIEIKKDSLNLATSTQRPMINQAPYVVNVALDYNNEDLGLGVRALYNVAGRRLVEVGSTNIPDSYQQPQHLVDLTVSKEFAKHWSVKLSATNLLQSDTIVTYGPANDDKHVSRVHNVAQTAGETTYYSDSRVWTISGTYTY